MNSPSEMQDSISKAAQNMSMSMVEIKKSVQLAFAGYDKPYCINCHHSNIETELPFAPGAIIAKCNVCGVKYKKERYSPYQVGYKLVEVTECSSEE